MNCLELLKVAHRKPDTLQVLPHFVVLRHLAVTFLLAYEIKNSCISLQPIQLPDCILCDKPERRYLPFHSSSSEIPRIAHLHSGQTSKYAMTP